MANKVSLPNGNEAGNLDLYRLGIIGDLESSGSTYKPGDPGDPGSL